MGARHSNSLEQHCRRTACLRGELILQGVQFSRKLAIVDTKRGYVDTWGPSDGSSCLNSLACYHCHRRGSYCEICKTVSISNYIVRT